MIDLHPAIRIAMASTLDRDGMSEREQNVAVGRLMMVARDLGLPMPSEDVVRRVRRASCRQRAARAAGSTIAGRRLAEYAAGEMEMLGREVLTLLQAH